MTTLEQLQAKRAKIAESIEALKAAVAADGRVEFTSDEMTQMNGHVADFDNVSAQIDLQKKADAISASMSAPQPRMTVPEVTTSTPAPITGGTSVAATYGNKGFRNMTDYLNCVRNASMGRVDQRLIQMAQTTYGQEGAGADGGFAVPPDFQSSLTSIVMGEDSLLSKFQPIVTSSNIVVLPTDETTPWGTSGIIAEWLGEAQSMTARKPSLKQVNVNLYKVGALINLTDELAADAPAIQSHVTRKIGQALAGKINDALINGDGAQKPLGLLNAPGLVTQAKSGSTLAAVDLANMLTRMPPESVGNAFWIMHSGFLPKLWTLTLGQMPVVVPDFTKSPYGTLLGKPIVISEYCQDYNTAGDIFLFSPDGYAAATKATGIDTQASIHFAFDQGLQTFRAIMRVGGTPLASGTITRKNGSLTLSHIVCLQARS